MVLVSEFGSWKSSIASKIVANDEVCNFSLWNTIKVSNGVVFWNEPRPEEAGRVGILSATTDQQTTKKFTEWTPSEFSVRSSVHEYGGGAFWVSPTSNTVFFVNEMDQQIYQQTGPTIMPEQMSHTNNCRYADGVVSKAEAVMFVVCEDHTPVVNKEALVPENTLALVDLRTKTIHITASGADFYASPTISSNGTRLAWMEWDLPNLPWDSTSISVMQLDPYTGHPIPESTTKIMNEPSVSYVAPVFANGLNNDLYFASDETNWWNVYSISIENIQNGANHIYPQLAEQCGPHWYFGNTIFAVEDNIDVTRRVVISQNHYSELILVNLDSGTTQKLDTGYKVHFCVKLCGVTNRVYFFGGAPDKWNSVVAYDITDDSVIVIQSTNHGPVPVDYVSFPTHITFPTTPDEGDSIAHGYFYPPKNPNHKAPKGSLPPLIVTVHGGIIAAAVPLLEMKRLYFTSRGFAILDVNFRGSTGYGRKFRELLKEQWGVRDVDDCCNGARYLVEKGIVDGTKLCITGISAGGFTALSALTFRETFHVGSSFCGLFDLSLYIVEGVHKFQSKQPIYLFGPYPEAKAIYEQRCPAKCTDQLNTPFILFHGSMDTVLSPRDSMIIFETAKKKGLTASLILFEDEGHSFSNPENLKTALEGEYHFFCTILRIVPTPDVTAKVRL